MTRARVSVSIEDTGLSNGLTHTRKGNSTMKVKGKTLGQLRSDLDALVAMFGSEAIVAERLELIPEIAWVTDTVKTSIKEYDGECTEGTTCYQWIEIAGGLECGACGRILRTEDGLKVYQDATTLWYTAQAHDMKGERYLARFVRKDMLGQGRIER